MTVHYCRPMRKNDESQVIVFVAHLLAIPRSKGKLDDAIEFERRNWVLRDIDF